MEKIQKIRKTSAPDLVCEKIQEMISQGLWSYDQKIPSENELADSFGVNRLTVRIALQKLNTLGILDTRVGDGTYVRHFDFDQHIDNIAEFYMTPKLLNDVYEFRMLIEVESVRLAIERYSLEELEQLREYAEQFEAAFGKFFQLKQESADTQVVNDAFSVVHDMDIAFHRQLCVMSHNDLILHAFSVAKPAIRAYMEKVGQDRVPNIMDGETNTSARHHWNIYYAIKNKDFETCKKLCMDMLDYHILEPTRSL